jgi:spermidine synthase
MVLPFLTLAAPAWLLGAIFAEGAALGPASRIYLWESAGAFTGGLLATGLYRLNPSVLVVLAGGGAALALFAWRWRWGSGSRLPFVLLIASLIVFACAFPLERWTHKVQWPRYTLLAQRETPYEQAALVHLGDLHALFENGIVSAQFPDPASQEEEVHWPLLLHAAPERVLALGISAAVALPEILKHPVRSVNLVNPDPAVLDLVKPYLDRSARSAWDDRRVHWITADPRAWVRRHPGAYDVILQTWPDPQNAALNRLFTRDFFEEAQRALRPRGVLEFTMASSENYLPDEVAYTNAVLLASVQAAFPYVDVIPGSRMIVLAGDHPLALEPVSLARRYAEHGIKNRVLVPSNFPYLLSPERRSALRLRLAEVRHVLPNTDLWPVSTFMTWRVWLSKFVDPGRLLGLVAAIMILFGALAWLWRRRRDYLAAPEALIVLAMGFAGMSFEIVLLFVFQSVSGALYWQMGLLMGVFMAGLAIGSGTLQAAPVGRHRFALLACIALLLAAACAAIASQLPHLFTLRFPLAGFAVLLAGAGCLVGAAYPLAASPSPDQASAVYAADLWGSALGAFTAGAFLAPLAGCAATLAISAGIVLSALLAAPVLRKRRL